MWTFPHAPAPVSLSLTVKTGILCLSQLRLRDYTRATLGGGVGDVTDSVGFVKLVTPVPIIQHNRGPHHCLHTPRAWLSSPLSYSHLCPCCHLLSYNVIVGTGQYVAAILGFIQSVACAQVSSVSVCVSLTTYLLNCVLGEYVHCEHMWRSEESCGVIYHRSLLCGGLGIELRFSGFICKHFTY